MLSVLLCFAATIAVSTARSSGAPMEACEDLQPMGRHIANGNMEQATSNPWTIDICNFDEIGGYYTYTPGQTYNITLRLTQDAPITLRGFFIQGRTQLQNDMVGTFTDPSLYDDMTRLSSCDPPEVGVTHNNPGIADRTGPLTFTWTAPAAGTGPIWFRYSIVQNITIWWADDSTAIVQEVDNLVFPSSAPQLQGLGFWILALFVAAAGLAI